MAILNYTTSVPATKTVGEIQALLVKAKASAVLQEFDENGLIEAISFRISTTHGVVHYKLPANVEGVWKVLQRQKVEKRYKSKERASWVAWRICKDWIEAQLAMVEAEIATLPQIFLPYAKTSSGETVYERVEKHGLLLLEDKR